MFGLFMDRGWFAATLVGSAVFLGLSVVAALGVGRRTA
jgi:MFS transporter, FSR family, fosmidomycin resistance protein